MNYIVFDMEWNQPSNPKAIVRAQGVTLHSEIIQIGAVKLNDRFEEISDFNIMIKPKYYTKMHGKVSKLTGITKEDLKFGFKFDNACEKFFRWCGEDFALMTWGSDDICVLKDNMAIHRIDTGAFPVYFDLQYIFDDQVTKNKTQCALTHAVELVGAECDLEAHDALNDAKMTAAVCRKLDMEKGFEDYERLKIRYEGYESPSLQKLMPEKSFKYKPDAVDELLKHGFTCPRCGAPLVCKEFIPQNSDRRISIGECGCGYSYFLRARAVSVPEERYSAVSSMHELEDGDRERYDEKLAACKA